MPDVNILIYAHRADEIVHEPYKAWLEQEICGSVGDAVSFPPQSNESILKRRARR